MGKTAFLFPGQGSQEIGMGQELASELPEAAHLLEEACDVLSRDMKKLMWEGPEEVLRDTAQAQPAIFICSAMALEKAKAQGINFDFVAGHSLGEYSALYAAGVFSFADGLRLVARRGEFMGQMNGKGTMAAVIGMSEEELGGILSDVSPDGSVVMANLNTPAQIVVSGEEDGITRLEEKLADRDGISVKRLKVSAAFHSPQMAEAAGLMTPLIEAAPFGEPKATVFSNVTGAAAADTAEIKRNLIAQITGQVRWCDTIHAMQAAGAETFYEVGHGKVLRRMQRLVTPGLRCLAI